MICGRAEKWLEIGHNKEDIILLPYHHRFARLYCEYIHAKGHHGVLTTAGKIRARFWITQLLKMIQSVKLNCVTCEKLDKKLSGQVMENLPKERLKPAPPSCIPHQSTYLDPSRSVTQLRSVPRQKCMG